MRLLFLLIPFIPKGPLRYEIKAKEDSALMRLFGFLLKPLLGPHFMWDYWTTFGETIYYPGSVEDPRQHPLTIEHEVEHIRQLRFWGILFWILYLLALPVGFNPFRFYWEVKAYRVGKTKRETILRHLSGPAYGYTMPKFLARLFL